MPLLFHGSHLTTRKVIEHVQLTVYIPQLTIHEPNIKPLQVTTTRKKAWNGHSRTHDTNHETLTHSLDLGSIPNSGKLSKGKTVANWWKIWLCGLLAFAMPKDATPPNFTEKSFANSPKTAKFAKGSPLKVSHYTVYNKLWGSNPVLSICLTV